MKYKLVCVDLDGTLLTSDKKLTAETKDTLKAVRDLGAVVAVSTGRTFVDARYYSDLAGIESPVISSNGAYVRDKDMGKVLYQNTLGHDLLKKILDICNKHGITPCFNTPFTKYYGDEYAKLLDHIDDISKKINRSTAIYKRVQVQDIGEWNDIVSDQSDSIVKCEIYTDKKVIVKIRKELEELGEVDVIYSTFDSIEITSKGTNKGKGLRALSDHLSIPIQQTIAIGDSENDLSMLKVAGLGIAMDNAEDFLKEAADYITSSNDDNGVAEVLKRFIIEA